MQRLSKEPILETRLFQMAGVSIHIKELPALAEKIEFDKQTYQKLDKRLSELDKNTEQKWKKVFSSEVVFRKEKIFQSISKEEIMEFAEEKKRFAASGKSANLVSRASFTTKKAFLYTSSVRKLDHAFALYVFKRIGECLSPPYYDKNFAEVDRLIKDGPTFALLSKATLSLYGTLMKIVVRYKARIRAARLFLALLMHREKHGGLPDTLADIDQKISPGVLRDPLSGELFTYTKTQDGFKVESSRADIGPHRDLSFEFREDGSDVE